MVCVRQQLSPLTMSNRDIEINKIQTDLDPKKTRKNKTEQKITQKEIEINCLYFLVI